MPGYTAADRAKHAQALSPTGVRRGDLVVTVTTTTYTYTDRHEDATEVEVAVATSVTREGRVKEIRHAWQGDDEPGRRLELITGLRQIMTFPATKIDVTAALETARAHTWPNSLSGMPKPYDTVEQVRDALRPHLLNTEAGS